MRKEELLFNLDKLGYKISKNDSFNYYNSSNEIKYSRVQINIKINNFLKDKNNRIN